MTHKTRLPTAFFTSLTLLVTTGTGCQGLGRTSGRTGGPTAVPRPAGVDLYVQGYLDLQRGEAQRAEQSLLAAVNQNPDLRMARATLGDLYRLRGDWQRAAGQYEAAVRLDPDTLGNHYYLGLSYQFLRRLQEAATAYQQALRLDPDDFNSNMNLGLVYLGLDRLDEAVYFLDRATVINPQNAFAWSNLGVAHDNRGNFVLAEASYRRALELDPDSPTALQNLGTNLVSQNRGREAVGVMERVVGQVRTPITLKRFGDALALVDAHDDALRQYDAALTLDPNFTPALNAVGSLYLRQYEAGLELDETLRRRAVEQWRRSLTIRADQPAVRELLERWGRGVS